jgi:hypothetical protein
MFHTIHSKQFSSHINLSPTPTFARTPVCSTSVSPATNITVHAGYTIHVQSLRTAAPVGPISQLLLFTLCCTSDLFLREMANDPNKRRPVLQDRLRRCDSVPAPSWRIPISTTATTGQAVTSSARSWCTAFVVERIASYVGRGTAAVGVVGSTMCEMRRSAAPMV